MLSPIFCRDTSDRNGRISGADGQRPEASSLHLRQAKRSIFDGETFSLSLSAYFRISLPSFGKKSKKVVIHIVVVFSVAALGPFCAT